MAGFQELTVWRKGVDLTVLIYGLTKQFPKDELYGLTSQIRRSAVSIPSNIAEGHRRNNRNEFKQFCGIALGSSAELETQLIIASKIYPTLEYKQALELSVEIQKMLNSLIAKLRRN